MMIKKYIFLIGVCLLAAGVFFARPAAAETADKKMPPVEREDAFLAEIHRHLLNRDQSFTVIADEKLNVLFGGDSEYLFEAVFESGEKTGDDFDYLRYNVKSYQYDVKVTGQEAVYYFTVAYYDSLTKARSVNQAVKKAIKNLRLQDVQAEVKALQVHDYITANAALRSGSGKDGASEALKKSASSRGYALLTYQMMREAGIPCRIVSGKMEGSAHIWNIVKLGDEWYHMDNGGDAAGRNPQIPFKYTYFLVGTNTMQKSHVMDDVYLNVDFESDHPLSRLDYAGRGKLILASDAKRVREKSGVGLFNETYDRVSNILVDPVERMNDRLADSLLDGLSGVFGGI